MAISLADLRSTTATLPPRLCIYGPEGTGKTTLAASMPAPVFAQFEDGTPGGLELQTFGTLKTHSDMMDIVSTLYSENHGFKTLVVDSMSAYQPALFAEVCQRHGKKSIEDFGYGKGYTHAAEVFGEFMEGINALRRDKGMMIALLAHSTISNFDDPETQSYSRYDIALHKTLSAMIARDMDAIFLLKRNVSVKTQDQGFNKERTIAEGGGQVWLHAEGRPSYVAKNRFGLPAKVRIEKEAPFDAIREYLPGLNTNSDNSKTSQKAA
jgi:ABC-type uncharacterized transport system YnjBCD ATPase subunit